MINWKACWTEPLPPRWACWLRWFDEHEFIGHHQDGSFEKMIIKPRDLFWVSISETYQFIWRWYTWTQVLLNRFHPHVDVGPSISSLLGLRSHVLRNVAYVGHCGHCGHCGPLLAMLGLCWSHLGLLWGAIVSYIVLMLKKRGSHLPGPVDLDVSPGNQREDKIWKASWATSCFSKGWRGALRAYPCEFPQNHPCQFWWGRVWLDRVTCWSIGFLMQ